MNQDKIACYTFLPWTRKGIAAKIKEKESFGASSSSDRATIDVGVIVKRKNLQGQTDEVTVNKAVSLFGPGDIIGIDQNSIIRTEPRADVTNFESNYLPYIEFSEEDYIWRYSPAAPAGDGDKRLRPWLALIVLKEEEEFTFKEFNPLNQPLPSISFTDGIDFDLIFPKKDEYWAWGHVHTNQLLSDEDQIDEGRELQNLINSNPNLACCRLLSPRKLEANTRYQAFLIPAYEKGRLAGLGMGSKTIDAAPSQQYSWANMVSDMPFYYNWTFRTGDQGDFEALVRRLEPKELDSRVGRRLIDIQDAGYGISYEGDAELDTTNHKGAIYLEGALRVCQNNTVNFVTSQDSTQTVKALSDVLNLDEDMRTQTTIDSSNTFKNHPHFTQNNTPTSIEDDPIITPPIYGKWHNLVKKVDSSKPDQWINHLNLDPRQRTAAGFGTNVIKKNQENYMDRAWGQYGDILEANRKLIQSQFVERFSANLYKNKILKLSDEKLLQETFTIHSRVKLSNNFSVGKVIDESRLSNAVVSAEYNKTTRPNGPITSFLKNKKTLDDKVLSGVASGQITAATSYQNIQVDADGSVEDFKQVYSVNSNISVDGVNTRTIHIANFNVSPRIESNLPRIENLRNVPLDTNTNRLGGGASRRPGIPANPTNNELRPEPDIDLGNDISLPVLTIEPTIDIIFDGKNAVINTSVKQDLTVSFNNIPKEIFSLSQSVFSKYLNENNWAEQAPKEALKVKDISQEIRAHIDPKITYTSRVLNRLHLGEKFKLKKPKVIEPIMVAPEFCDPMYKELVNISSELFLPNLNLIKNNTISVLETNPEFIESYMVGLNHEFSRELLWREYLTDQRGSYFRQFWETYSKTNEKNLSAEDFEEARKDIAPIHNWGNSKLGMNQPSGQTSGKKTVLVIRGDLLKKYPNTIIFMQEASYTNPRNPDTSKPRELKDGGRIITPSFEAKIDPDIYFIGFDISIDEARGDNANLKPGYFFMLQERTGEIHFGMDTTVKKNTIIPVEQIITKDFTNGVVRTKQSTLLTRFKGDLSSNSSWNDLAWEDIPGNSTHVNLSDVPSNPTREGLTWGDDAATMASILYQNPFMMAIHASEMISSDCN